MRQATTAVVISAAMIAAGCTSLGFSGDFPADEEEARAKAAIAQFRPGAPENVITDNFQQLDYKTVGRWGILDVSSYDAQGYQSRTYWIGYRYHGTSAIVGHSSPIETARVMSVTTVNGKIESTFWP